MPKERRADIAVLLRDGYFSIHPDLTLKPNTPFTRAKLLRLIRQIYEKKKWMPEMLSGDCQTDRRRKTDATKAAKREKQLTFRPDVFLFREFGGTMYPVSEAALVGGEKVSYQTRRSRRRQISRDQADRNADNGRTNVAVGRFGTNRYRPARFSRGFRDTFAASARFTTSISKRSAIRAVRSSLRSSARTASKPLKAARSARLFACPNSFLL